MWEWGFSAHFIVNFNCLTSEHINKQQSLSWSVSVTCWLASRVDCRDPNNASSEVIVQYTSTRVGSVIFYQCQQSGFAPSSSSAVCMESGRWSPDPSQVVCRMVTTSMPLPTGRVLWFDSLKFLIEPSEWQSITCEINDHSEVASLLIHSSVMSWKLLLFVFRQIRTSLPLQ